MKRLNASMAKTLVCVLALLLLGACQTERLRDADEAGYSSQSWRETIPESCRVFFDGCNPCRREPGAEAAACTRKACVKYREPVCLDNP